MLRNLQKSVEEEEQVWKARVGAKEEELHKVGSPFPKHLTTPSPMTPRDSLGTECESLWGSITGASSIK